MTTHGWATSTNLDLEDPESKEVYVAHLESVKEAESKQQRAREIAGRIGETLPGHKRGRP